MDDIKSILIKNQKKEITVEETFNEINNLVKENGYYNIDNIQRSFELGKLNEPNDIISNDNILELFDNNIDEFVNFISINGFFSKTDIDSWYKIGNINRDSIATGETVKQMCMNAFNVYLISNFD